MSSTHAYPNRHRVLDAARELFRLDTYDISMSAVAARAGVSKQTVYSHFDSKQSLIAALIEQALRPLHRVLDEADGSVDDLLRALALAYKADAGAGLPGMLSCVFQTQPPKALASLREVIVRSRSAAVSRLATRIRQAMNEGRMRDDNADLAANVFFALVRGLPPGSSDVETLIRIFMQAYALPDAHAAR